MEILLALSVLKVPLGIKLFLNIIPVLIGLFYIVKQRRVDRFIAPALIMIFLNMVLGIYLKDWMTLIRLGQLTCMLGFSYFICDWINEERLLLVCRYMIIISCITFILEIFFKGAVSAKHIAFNFYLPRFEGPMGESNFTAIIFAVCSMVFFHYKKWMFSGLSFILIVLCASRTSAIMVLLFIIFNLMFLKRRDYLRYVAGVMFFFMLISPFMIWLIERYADLPIRSALERASAGRYYLQVAYVDMGIKNILGVGYFNGWNQFMEYLTPYLPIVDSIRTHQNNEQHSIFIQVFSEFGVIGYLFFIWQILNVCKMIMKQNAELLFLISVVFFGYCFLNGLSDFILYLVIGAGMSLNLRKRLADY